MEKAINVTIYLIGIKCMMNLLVTKVIKFIRLFNSKFMIISITHKIMDTKLYDYLFMVIEIHCYKKFMDFPKVD